MHRMIRVREEITAAMKNYGSIKPPSMMKMSGSKKRMSVSNLIGAEEAMNYNSNQNNTFRMKNYQTHKQHNYSTGQGGMQNRPFTKSQRDLHGFAQSRVIKSPSNRKLMKNNSTLFLNRKKSRPRKSPMKQKSRSGVNRKLTDPDHEKFS